MKSMNISGGGRPHPLFMVKALCAEILSGLRPEGWDARRMRTLARHNEAAIEQADVCRDALAAAEELVEKTGPLEWMARREEVRLLLLEARQTLPFLILGMGVVWAAMLGEIEPRRGRGMKRREDVAELINSKGN